MIEVNDIIKSLNKGLIALVTDEWVKLSALHDKLTTAEQSVYFFEDNWVGGWLQTDYNCYKNLPDDRHNIYHLKEEYLYDFIKKQCGVDIDNMSKQINKVVQVYKNFNNDLVADLSFIRDEEKFKQEALLLDKLESYSWGTHASDIVAMKRPQSMIVRNPALLNKGLQIPPHVIVMANYVELVTKCGACKNYHDAAKRILRQIEIKCGVKKVSSAADVLSQIFDNFHAFATQIKNRYSNRSTVEIKDEYDVQDLLHAVLKIHFKDIRAEEHTPSYAGTSTRLDFLLKDERVVIEVKKTRSNLKDKEVGEQLILDASYYKNHPDCSELYCFVYDPENRVKNPRGLENDLVKLSSDEMRVKVFIRP